MTALWGARPDRPATYWLGEPTDPTPNNHAPWIRGRVFKRGGTWYMQVVNIETGKVIASDNTGNYYVMQHDARETTAAARMAWMRGFKPRALQPYGGDPR